MGHYGINVFPVHFFLVISDTVYWSPLSSFLYPVFCFSFICLVIYSKILIGYLLYSKSLSHFHFPFCAVVYLISGLLFQTPLLSPHCSLLTQIQLYTPLMSQLRCQFFPSTNTSMSCLGALSCEFSELPLLSPIIAAFLLACVCY